MKKEPACLYKRTYGRIWLFKHFEMRRDKIATINKKLKTKESVGINEYDFKDNFTFVFFFGVFLQNVFMERSHHVTTTDISSKISRMTKKSQFLRTAVNKFSNRNLF